MSCANDLEKPLPCERMLGVMWDVEADTLSISVSGAFPDASKAVTKRRILRVVASVFDPLGFVLPFVLMAKLQLQALWSNQQDWDEPLSAEESDRWTAWLSELPLLSDITLLRWYSSSDASPVTRELHVFCDGSERAFGAVAYI